MVFKNTPPLQTKNSNYSSLLLSTKMRFSVVLLSLPSLPLLSLAVAPAPQSNIREEGEAQSTSNAAATATADDEASSITLRIIHITDVYTLENFPSLQTLIADQQEEGVTTVSMLTGDFLMPYLLSSVDGGKGMMDMINAVPIDYLTWGNHEKDLPHEQLMEREREYNGIWINTNMQSHESYAQSTCQTDVAMIDLENDEEHQRRVAVLGILTNSKSLYPPGSFNGAVIQDPWESMREYQDALEGDDSDVDLILPICHLYEPQDERTAAEFDFPLIIGGHDHHPVDRLINGTLLLKPGQDGHYARVIDIRWTSAATDSTPIIQSKLLRVQDYAPNATLQQLADESYQVLDSLRHTQLGTVPASVRPLSSKGARSQRVSVATFLGNTIRDSLDGVDAFVAKGGNIRGGRDYDDGDDEEFTLFLLRSELENVDLFVTQLPGSVLRVGLRETWTRPGTGWFQHDDGVIVDNDGYVVSIGGEPLDPDRMYNIATMEDFFRSRDGPSIGRYYEASPRERIPTEGIPVYDVILSHLAEQLWDVILGTMDVDESGSISEAEFDALDINDNGSLDQDDMLDALHQIAGLTTHPGVYTLVDFVLAAAAGGVSSNDNLVSLVDVNSAKSRKLSSSGMSVPESLNETRENCGIQIEKQ